MSAFGAAPNHSKSHRIGLLAPLKPLPIGQGQSPIDNLLSNLFMLWQGQLMTSFVGLKFAQDPVDAVVELFMSAGLVKIIVDDMPLSGDIDGDPNLTGQLLELGIRDRGRDLPAPLDRAE